MRPTAPAQPSATNPPQASAARLPKWVLPILCVLGSAAITVAVCEITLGDIPPLMLGKWLIVEGEHEGATMEFLRDGTMVLALKQDGQEITFQGNVQMKENGFRVTLVNPLHGFKVTHEQTILDLTHDRFIVQDTQGEMLKMTRIP